MVLWKRCPNCSAPGAGRCDRCWPKLTRLGGAAPCGTEAVFSYDEPLRSLLLPAKNGGRADLLSAFGLDLAAELRERRVLQGGLDTVTWVPASRLGKRRRGYDQGRLLARAVAGQLRLRAQRLLLRPASPTQAGRTRSDRLAGPAFRCPLVLEGRRLLLIDDVLTTGASMREAARTLQEAGADVVLRATVAYRLPADGGSGGPSGDGLWLGTIDEL